MTVSTTPRFLLPYPEDNEPIRNLPDILQQQAEGIESALTRFDYQGGDQAGLTSRVASLETLVEQLRDNVVTLYDNDDNTLSGAITLGETAANFEKLTICFKTNNNVYASMDVANPDGKAISLTTGWYLNTSAFYVKTRCYKIEGRTINTYKPGGTYVTGEVNAAGNNAASNTDVITITQVYGTRRMALS